MGTRRFTPPLLVALLPLLFCRGARAQGAAETITELSREIHTQLDGLRRQSRDLTERLLLAESELRESSTQAEALRTELRGLNSCLESTSERLAGYSAKLTEYEAKLKEGEARLKESRKKVRTLGVILAAGITLFVLVRAATIILKLKGVKLPETVNILL